MKRRMWCLVDRPTILGAARRLSSAGTIDKQ
jgi:hypothetical protein